MGDRVFQEVRKPFNHTDFDMKIVTGHKGFIGGRLKARLEEIGKEEVFGIEADDWVHMPVHYLIDIISNSSGVYHIGANSSTTYDNPDIFKSNVSRTWQILQLCRRNNKRMVFASSASIYGAVGGRMSGDQTGPQNFYAWTKWCAELACQSYKEFVSLRYFNVYGPDESHKGNMASVAYQAHKHHRLTGESFKLFTGDPQRDFVYVDDVVDATIHAMELAPLPEFMFYDVGTGEARSFEALLDGMGVPYEYYTDRESEERKPDGYQKYTQAHPPAFLPGWTPKYSVEEGTKLYREYLDG